LALRYKKDVLSFISRISTLKGLNIVATAIT